MRVLHCEMRDTTHEVREIAQTRQFTVPLAPLALTLGAHDAQFGGIPYRHADVRLPLAGTQLTALVPLQPALEGARARARLVVLGIAAAIACAGMHCDAASEVENRNDPLFSFSPE